MIPSLEKHIREDDSMNHNEARGNSGTFSVFLRGDLDGQFMVKCIQVLHIYLMAPIMSLQVDPQHNTYMK